MSVMESRLPNIFVNRDHVNDPKIITAPWRPKKTPHFREEYAPKWENEWELIETAPTNRDVIIWLPDAICPEFAYTVNEHEWRKVGSAEVISSMPSHWMPMPAAPA